MLIRKVLISLDISELSAQVLPIVRHLFAPKETDITLISVVHSTEMAVHPPSVAAKAGQVASFEVADQERWEKQIQLVKEAVNKRAKELRQAGYPVTTSVRVGDPVQQIVTCAEEGDFDLLAMSTHGSTGEKRQLLGSIAEKVLRRSSVPVLFLRPFTESGTETTSGAELAQSLEAAQQISLAIATDGSTHAQQALTVVCSLARALHVDLKVIVVADEHEGATHAQHLMQRVHECLIKLKLHAELVPLVGRADVVLDRYLNENPLDLLVIGGFKDRDAGPISDIGIMAQHVVQHAPTSVLIVKGYPHEFRKILVCVGENDLPVLDVAGCIAKATGAQIQLLHVLAGPIHYETPFPNLSEMPLNEILVHGLFRREERIEHEVIPVTFDEALTESAVTARFLQKAVARLESLGFERDMLLIRRGPIFETILYMAEQEQNDLIAIGSHARSSYFLGNDADAILRIGSQSVLIVRSEAK